MSGYHHLTSGHVRHRRRGSLNYHDASSMPSTCVTPFEIPHSNNMWYIELIIIESDIINCLKCSSEGFHKYDFILIISPITSVYKSGYAHYLK